MRFILCENAISRVAQRLQAMVWPEPRVAEWKVGAVFYSMMNSMTGMAQYATVPVLSFATANWLL